MNPLNIRKYMARCFIVHKCKYIVKLYDTFLVLSCKKNEQVSDTLCKYLHSFFHF